jgi:IstB-like ATP binding protein
LIRVFNQRREQITLHHGTWRLKDLRALVEEPQPVATGKFICEAKDDLLLGPPGVGKTHLAQAIGHEAIWQNFQVLYRSIFDLVRDFMKDKAFNQQEQKAAQISPACAGKTDRHVSKTSCHQMQSQRRRLRP